MRSDAPRSVGAVGAANRTVITITVMMVAITVMVRICLVDSHSPIGADASGSIDAIDTGCCVARLSEHERAKCNDDGEHRCAISGDAQHRSFHFGYLLVTGARMIHRCSTMKTPAMTTGVSVPTAFRDAGKCIIPLRDKSMRAQYANAPKSCNKYPTN
jgi:hypothetical protein